MKFFKKELESIPVICEFDLNRYLGKWYEIGRLPFSSEKGLSHITATYNLKKNEKIEVINSGYKRGKERSVKGTAWIPNKRCKGRLLVTFFRPFKGEYNIIILEENYNYVVIMGKTRKNLWILSRTPKMDKKVYKDIIKYLDKKGFATKKIINPKQNRK